MCRCPCCERYATHQHTATECSLHSLLPAAISRCTCRAGYGKMNHGPLSAALLCHRRLEHARDDACAQPFNVCSAPVRLITPRYSTLATILAKTSSSADQTSVSRPYQGYINHVPASWSTRFACPEHIRKLYQDDHPAVLSDAREVLFSVISGVKTKITPYATCLVSEKLHKVHMYMVHVLRAEVRQDGRGSLCGPPLELAVFDLWLHMASPRHVLNCLLPAPLDCEAALVGLAVEEWLLPELYLHPATRAP